MIGFQVCSKEEDTYEIAKIHCQSFKTLLSRITWSILNSLATRYPWVKGIPGFTYKEQSIFKNEIMRFSQINVMI